MVNFLSWCLPAEQEKLLLVFGATGQQGGSVIKAIIASNQGWKIRAVTRNPSKDSAKWLRDLKCVEVVKGDADNLDTSLFDGVTAAFIVTNYWAHGDADREMKQIAGLAKAAEHVPHVVFSTLEDYRQNKCAAKVPSIGKWKCPHFDAKGACDKLFAKENTTFLRAAFYLDNLISQMTPQPNDDGCGTYTFALPMGDKTLAMVSKEDIGRCAAAAFNDPETYKGLYIGASTCLATGEDICEAYSKVLDIKVNYYAMSRDDYANLPFPGAADVSNMFTFHKLDNANFIKQRTENSPLKKTQTLVEWMTDNKHKMTWAHTIEHEM